MDGLHCLLYSTILNDTTCIGNGWDIWIESKESKESKKCLVAKYVVMSLGQPSHWKEGNQSFPMVYNMLYIK